MKTNKQSEKIANFLFDVWDYIRKPIAFFSMIAIVLAAMWVFDHFTKNTDSFVYIFLIFMAVMPIILFIAYILTKYDLIKSALWGGGIAAVMTIPICLIGGAMVSEINTKPTTVEYHNAKDLEKATGVEFPEVIPVDSTYHDDWNNSYTEVKFIAPHGLKKSFYRRLDKACKDDSLLWIKIAGTKTINDEAFWHKSVGDSLRADGYYYYVLPSRIPFNRLKGDSWRMKNGSPDWDGDYISVFVPINGDTITVVDGWAR